MTSKKKKEEKKTGLLIGCFFVCLLAGERRRRRTCYVTMFMDNDGGGQSLIYLYCCWFSFSLMDLSFSSRQPACNLAMNMSALLFTSGLGQNGTGSGDRGTEAISGDIFLRGGGGGGSGGRCTVMI